MKIAVIGANGKTGRAFVAAALAAGHEVVAGIHRRNDLPADPNCEARRCDTSDLAQVQTLLQGCDAVVSTIGHGYRSPADLQTKAIKNIARAMEDQSLRRIISLTGTGVRQPGDHIGLFDRMTNATLGIIAGSVIADGMSHLRALEQTSLDYTVVRALKLTNGAVQPYALTTNGPAINFVARRTVAAAMLECLLNDHYVRACPLVSRP